VTERHQFEHQRARELAGFLRSRRARIDPEQVGFPVGARRRSQGLRREEVAVLAGVSPTWYTYLEQGRNINPSPEVLDSLAQVLLLTEDERRYVHLLALGHPPVVTAQPSGSSDLLADVVAAIGDCPHPLYAENHRGDVIAWNQAAVHWYTDFAALPTGRCNMLWWLMTSPEARQRIPDWAEDAHPGPELAVGGR
jgi:transcriptional regulator with XRE-family HTH domain